MRRLLAVIIILLLWSLNALGAEWLARLERSTKPEEVLKNLSWVKNEVAIHFVQEAANKSQPVVILKGSFQQPGWYLIWKDQKLKEGTFSLKIPLQGPVTAVRIQAVGPSGKVELESLNVRFLDWELYALTKSPVRPKQSFYTPSLGLNFLSYSEPGISDFSQIALNAKFQYAYHFLPSRWELHLGVFGDVLSLKKSGSDSAARMVGVNARAGYVLPWLKTPWKLKLLAGWEYSRMFVSHNSFGYKNLVNLQLFPTLERNLGNSSLQGFVRFTPMSKGVKLIPLSNHQLNLGLGWVRSLRNNHSVGLSLEYGRTKMNYDSREFTSSGFSLSTSFGF